MSLWDILRADLEAARMPDEPNIAAEQLLNACLDHVIADTEGLIGEIPGASESTVKNIKVIMEATAIAMLFGIGLALYNGVSEFDQFTTLSTYNPNARSGPYGAYNTPTPIPAVQKMAIDFVSPNLHEVRDFSDYLKEYAGNLETSDKRKESLASVAYGMDLAHRIFLEGSASNFTQDELSAASNALMFLMNAGNSTSQNASCSGIMLVGFNPGATYPTIALPYTDIDELIKNYSIGAGLDPDEVIKQLHTGGVGLTIATGHFINAKKSPNTYMDGALCRSIEQAASNKIEMADAR